jgi:hypothetical protein
LEELHISTSGIVVHLLITCIPWLVGLAVGGGLGWLCGLAVRAVITNGAGLRRTATLLPWRTLVMGLLMGIWSPFIATLLWLGPVTGGLVVACSVSVLVTVFTATTIVETWVPSPLASRLIAGARSMAVASGLLAVGAGLLGGGGLGPIMLEAARLSQYDVIWKGVLVVLALALVLDLTLGLAQMMALSDRTGEAGITAETVT